MDDDDGLEAIADQFELSSRQIRRIIKKELGVSPIQLILTRRLLLAKQLLTETGLPVTEIAFASGFSSLRRFNDAFGSRYGMPPSRLRKKAVDDAGDVNGSGYINAANFVSPAVRLAGNPGFPESARIERRRIGDGRLLCPDRAVG